MKAVHTIEICQVIASPRTSQGRMMALDVVNHADVDLDKKEFLPLHFPMTYDRVEREDSHREAAMEIAAFLDDGKDVAMLTLGDPSIYATASYVEQILGDEGYDTEVVPGVPSFCAAAAGLRKVLAEDKEPLAIIPASAGEAELSRALDAPGTKVIMKSGSKILDVLDVLQEKDLLTQTWYAENIGLPGEQTGSIFNMPEHPGYFTTLIVTDRK